MSTFQPLPASAAETIASYSLLPPNGASVEIGQARHRIRLVNAWHIAPGRRVLEIGCGQGNCTAVLAEAVGSSGHVDAVDPGSPDYGAPFTLAQAQAHINESVVGGRVKWHNADPVDFLKGSDDKWDAVVFAHCIWYFEGPELLSEMLNLLKGRVNEVCVAEYAFAASKKEAEAHVLAARARVRLESYNKTSDANIRNVLSPRDITTMAKATGWALAGEDTVVPDEDLLDGHWEAGTVKSSAFLTEIDAHVDDEVVRKELRAARDEVVRSMEALGGKRVWTMDVWVGRFVSS